MYADNNAQAMTAGTSNGIGMLQQPTLRQQLNDKKFRIEKQLAAVNEAIAALDENPGLEKFQDTIQKAQYL